MSKEISPAQQWAEPVNNLTIPVHDDSDLPPIQDRAAPTVLPMQTLPPNKLQESQSSQGTQALEGPVLRKRTREQTETSPVHTDKETKKVRRQEEKKTEEKPKSLLTIHLHGE